MRIQAFFRLYAIFGLGLCTGLASAEIVTLSMTGTVESVYDPYDALAGEVWTGQAVAGEFSYDTAVPDTDSNPENGAYPQDQRAVQMAFDIGSLRFASDPDAPTGFYQADVMNAPWGDAFHVGSVEGNQLLSTGATVSAMDVDLYDVAGTALSSDALPTTAPNIDAFTDRFVFFHGQAASGEHYDFRVQIETLSTGPAGGPEGTFEITAEVFDVHDPVNALGGQVMPGSRITGTLRIDVTTEDLNPDPASGHYPHVLQPGFGFVLNGGSLNFESETEAVPLIVDIDNERFGPYDRYEVHAVGGTWGPQGEELGYIDLFLEDFDGNALSNDLLSEMGPNLALFDGLRDLQIKGHVSGQSETWYIHAELLEMRPAGQSANVVIVSPGDGEFVEDQRFDAAFILPPGQDVAQVQGTINGIAVPETYLWGCTRSPPDLEGRLALLCPDMHQFLLPGSNTVWWTFEFMDHTLATELVNWYLRGPIY